MLKKAGESSGLEFNSPAHGNWNIVHTGMLLPEAIQIYVCADNCMRGVVLTAAEMNAADRFSFVIVEEEDLLNGNLEDVTIEGVTDVLKKRGDHPKAADGKLPADDDQQHPGGHLPDLHEPQHGSHHQALVRQGVHELTEVRHLVVMPGDIAVQGVGKAGCHEDGQGLSLIHI